QTKSRWKLGRQILPSCACSTRPTTLRLSGMMSTRSLLTPASAVGCYPPRRRPRFAASHLSADPAEPLDRAAQLVCVHACVALRRVEVLVAEQLLDLAQVRSGAQQFGGEDVTEGVWRH